MTPLPLNARTLPHHAARVVVPTYDRSALTPSVLHLSVGAFHRSHQAVYFDELARSGHTGWGLVGVGLHRPEMREVLAAQDGLYTVLACGARSSHARVVGVIGGYLFAPDDAEAVLDAIADPRLRLITLTITGAAYKVDPGTGLFDSGDIELAADLVDPHRPLSALGYIVEGLERRRISGRGGLTVLSCDNMAGNGVITRTAVTSFARLRDPSLAAWIDAECTFPSSMVDRITPRTTPGDRARLARDYGIDDRWPVITEPFSQWIVEDDFAAGRPPLEEVGVRFVDDVRPYALMKTRLLNASHLALGYLGSIAGHTRLHDVMADAPFARYVAGLMEEEIAPLLGPVAGVDVDEYSATLRERFANPCVADRLARLCRSGSAKMPAHVLSSIRDARRAERPHPRLTLAVAAWMRYLRGADEQGRRHDIEDRRGERLHELACAGGSDPRPLLAVRSVFGDLGSDEGFVAELERTLRHLDRDGVRAVLDETRLAA